MFNQTSRPIDDRVVRAPLVYKVQYLLPPGYHGGSLEREANEIINRRRGDIINFVQRCETKRALSTIEVVQDAADWNDLGLIYQSIQGAVTVYVSVYPQPAGRPPLEIDIGDMWKIGYDNDGLYPKDPTRDYSSRKWIGDPTTDAGVGSAIYIDGSIPSMSYWEVEIVSLDAGPNAGAIDWSSDTPPDPGLDKSVPAIGVQPDKGQDFYITDTGHLTNIFKPPTKSSTRKDIRFHTAAVFFLTPEQTGSKPTNVEGVTTEGHPVGPTIPRAVGVYRLYIQTPTGGGGVTSTIAVGGGWGLEIVAKSGITPDVYKVGDNYLVNKNSSGLTPPSKTYIIWDITYPVLMNKTDTFKYVELNPQQFIVHNGIKKPDEDPLDTIWTSVGLGPLGTNTPENAAGRTLLQYIQFYVPSGPEPDPATATWSDYKNWATAGAQVGYFDVQWTFTPITYTTVTTYPTDGNPFFLWKDFGWHTILIQGGVGALNATGTADQYTTTLWSGLDTHKPFKPRDPNQPKKPGDVLMFAMDRKRRNLWFGMNGKWLGKTPSGSGVGDVTLDPDTTYYPAFAYARGATKMHMLFASSQKYAAPGGFTPLPGNAIKLEIPL